MHSLSRDRIQIYWSYRNKRFSLSSFHFCDFPLVKDNSSHKLYIIRDHIPYHFLSLYHTGGSHKSFTSLFYHSKRLRQEIIKTLSILESCSKFLSLCLNLFIAQAIKFCIKMINRSNQWLNLIELFLIIITSNNIQNPVKHYSFKRIKTSVKWLQSFSKKPKNLIFSRETYIYFDR